MKTRVNSINCLVFTGMFFVLGISAKAGNGDRVYLIPEQHGKVVVEAFSPQKQAIAVDIISNTDQEVVYNSDLHKDNFYGKIFNLSNLPEGDYTVHVQIGNETFEDKIALGKAVPVILDAKTYFKPEFQDVGNTMVLTMLNPNSDQVVVSFWKDSEKFFVDPSDIHSSFRRKYNLKELEPGEYQVEVTVGTRAYQHTLNIR